ncbi:unnamed protein product [Strongylus vulgaris]|uniref:Uncharacterized protein n=1 Tax=Strongylus vulgaris TaxID=40348 RepID=A0A3P7L5U1_STRVU|nr:unnamed protein product [Strongylus vulgaris]
MAQVEGAQEFPKPRRFSPKQVLVKRIGGHVELFITQAILKVNGDEFPEDPTIIGHACIPIERTKEKAAKLSYEEKHGAGLRIEDGQVYTVHGICRGGDEIPLLFATMKKKREDYVFEKLRSFLETANPELADPQLRFVVDFELVSASLLEERHITDPKFGLERRIASAPLLPQRQRTKRASGTLVKDTEKTPVPPTRLLSPRQRVKGTTREPATFCIPTVQKISGVLAPERSRPYAYMWCKYLVHE